MLIQGKHYTTIWINNEDIVQIIDQTKLPYQFEIVNINTVEECCNAISSMQVRGAGLIGITAAMGVYIAMKNADDSIALEDFQLYMLEESAKLLSTRPTAKNLSWALDRQRAIWKGLTKEEALALVRAEALAILQEDIDYCINIGNHGCNIIEGISQKKSGEVVNILTHCNAGWLAFGDYGSALSPIYAAHRKGIKIHVWVDETRPRNQGASLTAFELSEQGVPHSLIADNTGGHLMQNGLVDMCIVGADRVTRNGDVANKIGTYLKALAAKDNSIPFYVALPSSTFDFNLSSGKDIPIEERSSIEVETMYGVACNELGEQLSQVPQFFRICPNSTKGTNYAFDVSPAKLITGLITEKGILKASEEDILKHYPQDNIN